MSPLFTANKFGFGRNPSTGAAVEASAAPGTIPTTYLKNSTVFVDWDWGRAGWSDNYSMDGNATTAAYNYEGTDYVIDSGIGGNVDAGSWNYQTDDGWNAAHTNAGGGRYIMTGSTGSPTTVSGA